MLYLITILDGQAYAIEAARTLEVLPLVRLERAPGPDHLATFRRRGKLASALDLSRVFLGRPFQPRLSTRILVTPHGDEAVGLVAENVTETLRIETEAFEPVRRPGEPAFLGPAALVGARCVRRIELEPLLAHAFQARAAAA